MKKKRSTTIIALGAIAFTFIVLGIVFLTREKAVPKKEKPTVEVENKTLEEMIKYDQEDASTGVYLTDENEFVEIESINLESSVKTSKVKVTFVMKTKVNIESPKKGTLVFRNNQDEIVETLTFDIEATIANEDIPVELTSMNLKTILTTQVTLTIE